MTKGILQSKTFWLNIVQTAAWSAGFVPPKYAVPIMAVSNILVRLLTESPIAGMWQ